MKIKSFLKKNVAFKGVFFSSFAMAFSGLGDTLLYAVLPIYGEEMGYSVLWVGIFLSINRFIRIPGNSLIALLISKKGYKKAMFLATFFAMLTTFLYGFRIGIFFFLLSRIMWGLSYSTLRISSLAYASEAKKNKNLMFGLVQSIKTTGAVLALFVGAFLIKNYSVKVSFIVLSLFSTLGILMTIYLPEIKVNSSRLTLKKVLYFSNINGMTFLTSFVVDGVLVVTISQLLIHYEASKLIVIVSGYLLFRKLCSSILSALFGWIADVFGVYTIFKISLSFVLLGLLLIANSYVEIGMIIAFLFNSIIVAMLPAIALKENSKDRLATLTSITTWWDVGAATGTLFGLYLINLLGASLLYSLFFGIFLIPIYVFFKNTASFSKDRHL